MNAPAHGTSWSHRGFTRATLPTGSEIDIATVRLDQQVRDMMQWHFDDRTGCEYWLDMRSSLPFDPIRDIRTAEAMLRHFPNFDEGVLKYDGIGHLIPRGFGDEPFRTYLTGGTTSGAPSRRPSWDDFKLDYSDFSRSLKDEHFPRGARWLFAGPSGPRRLPDAIPFLAALRGGTSQGIDCDPVGVKMFYNKDMDDAGDAYVAHVVGQVVRNLKTNDFQAMFTSPPLLTKIVAACDLYAHGIRGVFFGGTEITPEWMRIMQEEVGPNVGLYPTYGNTLMGLAQHAPVNPENDWVIRYYAPQPRAILRIVDAKDSSKLVPYGAWGRVQLSTLTKEFFAPCFLERDEAIRIEPTIQHPWDGVQGVRPFGAGEGKKVKTGVY